MRTPRITVNEDRNEVFVNGREVALAPKEYGIILALRNSNVTMSREKLLGPVWPERSGTDSRTVDQHIARLRRKIGNDAILTVSKYGYKIAA